MPKKIPIIQKREWLDSYEGGRSEASIAKKAHCDVRTVKRGIEDAKRERDAHTARAELLKDALLKHQHDLLDAIHEVIIGLPTEHYRIEVRGETDASPPPVPLPGATAKYESGKGWMVILNVESRPEWELVQEHLKRDPMWDALHKWKLALASHIEARMAFKRKVGTLLEDKTGFKLSEKQTSPPYLHYHTLVDLLFHVALNLKLGIPDDTKLENNIVADTGAGKVMHRSITILADAPGKEEECAKNIVDAFSELQESSEASRVQTTFRELEQSTTKARRAVEEISLLRLVPGQCRVCRRLGI